MLKIETSQHNPYELKSPCSMNVNEVAMPQYKPSEVSILQDKSKFIANERAMSQHVQSLKWLCPNVGSSDNSQSIITQVKTDYAPVQGTIPKEIVIDE